MSEETYELALTILLEIEKLVDYAIITLDNLKNSEENK